MQKRVEAAPTECAAAASGERSPTARRPMTIWLRRFLGNLGSGESELIKRILSENIGRSWKHYALVMFLTSLLAGCTAGTAYIVGSVVNATYLERNFSTVVLLSIAMISLFSLRGLFTYASAVLVARIGNEITAEKQQQVFDSVLRQGLGEVSRHRSSDYMTSAMIGAPAIAGILNMLVLALGRDVFMIVGLVGLMLWQDFKLTLACFLIAPIAVIIVQKLQKRVRAIAATQYAGTSQLVATLHETLQGLRIVKAFNLEQAVRTGVSANVDKLQRAANRMARVSNRTSPLTETLGGAAVGLVCLYGGYRVIEANAAPGELVSFMTAFLLAFEPVRRLTRLRIDLSAALVAARHLYGFLDQVPAEPNDLDRPALNVNAGRIELQNVSFSYVPGTPVLRDMTLTAEPGRVAALVGLSGAGKTTILNLLLRLYEVESGAIRIDGQDIREVSRHSLRASLSYVGQDVFLFHGTIRENILVGKSDASEDELVAVAQAASAHDFILSLPKGYDTQVGEAGALLSQGQRQRIALARALIKNAPIVLLDEPTASLDSESEHHVRAAIRRLCAGKTTLVIAHRLNTIRDADVIAVVEGGRIVETGRHEDLLRRGGRYATFFRLQFPEEAAT